VGRTLLSAPVDFDPAEVSDAHMRTGASPVPRSEASGMEVKTRHNEFPAISTKGFTSSPLHLSRHSVD
jgi:hypothetical protein